MGLIVAQPTQLLATSLLIGTLLRKINLNSTLTNPRVGQGTRLQWLSK